jgi:dTDP-4-dehydrorhamnose reductase
MILITGQNGWIGTIFKNYCKGRNINVLTTTENINDIQSLPQSVALVNFAAKTSIDWCEKNKVEAFNSNVIGAVHLANLCKGCGVKYVFISSACIFDSKDEKDIKYEDSKPSPKCFYTETKLMAEKLIRESNPKALILRPRLPISEVSHPRNTINKLAKYPKLIDCQESITVIEDFIPRILELIKEKAEGTFNIVNEGTISPAEIGDLMGYKFERYTKSDLDEQIKKSGQANRVSTIVGSHYGYLPPIKDRVKQIAALLRSGEDARR